MADRGIAHFMVACWLLFLPIIPVHSQSDNIDSLKRLLATKRGSDQIKTLQAIANEQHIDFDTALEYANKALRQAQELNDQEAIVTSYYVVGSLHSRQKSDSLAQHYLKLGLEIAEEQEDAVLICEGHLKLASHFLLIQQPQKTIEHGSQLLEIANENNLKKESASANRYIGNAYKSLGAYQNSLKHLLTALRINEEINDLPAIAKNSNEIGTLYQRTDDYEQALLYLNRALKINEANRDLNGVITNNLNIGVIYQKQMMHEDALSVYFKLLPITKELGDRVSEAIVTGNIGSTKVEQGNLKEGLEYLNQALAIKETVSRPRSIMHTLNDIANVKIKLGDGRGAKEAAERVVAMGKKHADSDQLLFGYLNLSKAHKLLKNYEQAYVLLEKHRILKDSLFGIEKAEQISELQIQYDTEKKDMAISALQQEKQIANAQRKIYFLLGAIILLISAALYINQRLKTKRNLQLLEKEREVDRLKSNFFANISHEFRTPLSLILGPLETMLSKTNNPDERFQLGLMKKSASRLLRLINQILELSRLESGHLELKAIKLNAVDLIRGVGATFQSLADEKRIALNIVCPEDEILVYCDQEKIETICINLISNAFKFTDEGGSITIDIARIDPLNSTHPAAGELEFRVTDTGIGIPPEHVKQIFDRFYRAGSSSAKQYGGTGIGLALTKELVELHHGAINVTSEVGVGTSVIVRIPLGKDHLKQDQIIQGETQSIAANSIVADIQSENLQPEYSTPEEEEVLADDFQKSIILLIEDNVDVRSYIKSILVPKYTLLEAVDGEEGTRMAKSFVPNLIISDVMMPKMNGYEVCRDLKQDEKTSHIPIILLTAKASINSRIEGLETEADLYLNKPFVPRELLLCIHNLIQSRRKLQERYNRQMVLKPSDIAINSVDEMFLQRLMKVIEANYEDENFSVEQLSTEIGMSRSQLHRKLHALTNESTSQFIRTYRLQRAMELLKKRHASISEIAFKVGFASHSYFNKCFQQHYGCTPSAVIEEAEIRTK